jgi:ArsR family transcriptional regulator
VLKMIKSELAECMRSGEILALYETLRIIADVNRLRIICLLFTGEKCVCDIEEKLQISQPLASHHLGVLREAGLVRVRREATWSYYSLEREAVERLNGLFLKVLGSEKLSEHYPVRTECEEPALKA